MDITAKSFEALNTAVRASYRIGAGKYAPIYEKIATIIESKSDSESYAWLGEFTNLKKWIGARQVDRMKLSRYTIENEPFEATEGIPGTYVRDDRYGILMKKFEDMGFAASCHPDELTFGLLASGFDELCYDNQPFFDPDHAVGDESVSNMQAGTGEAWYLLDTNRPLKPLIFQKREDYDIKSKTDSHSSDHVFMHDEYLYGVDARVQAGFGFWQLAFGSKADFIPENVWSGIQSMRSLKSDKGRPLGVNPNVVVVPPSYESNATNMFKAVLKEGGATNDLYNRLEVIVADYL